MQDPVDLYNFAYDYYATKEPEEEDDEIKQDDSNLEEDDYQDEDQLSDNYDMELLVEDGAKSDASSNLSENKYHEPSNTIDHLKLCPKTEEVSISSNKAE